MGIPKVLLDNALGMNYTYMPTNYGQFKLTITSSLDLQTPLIIPSDTCLEVAGGSVITVSAKNKLTINGPFDVLPNPLVIVFKGEGGVAFGGNIHRTVYPQWWGAEANNPDNWQAFDDCFQSVAAGGKIKIIITPLQYKLSRCTIVVCPGTSVNVSGYGATFLYNHDQDSSSAKYCTFVWTKAMGDLTIAGLKFNGDYHPNGNILPLLHCFSGDSLSGIVTIKDCHIVNFSGHGIFCRNDGTRILNNTICDCHTNGVDNGGCNHVLIKGNIINNSGVAAVDINDQGRSTPKNPRPRFNIVRDNKIKGFCKNSLCISNLGAIGLGGEPKDFKKYLRYGSNVARGNYIEFDFNDREIKTIITKQVYFHGIAVMGRNCVVSGNVIKAHNLPKSRGIWVLSRSYDSTIADNEIYYAEYGIVDNLPNSPYNYPKKNIIICKNKIESCNYPISATVCKNYKISKNCILNSIDCGIQLHKHSKSTIDGNLIECTGANNNYVGIELCEVSNSRIENNLIKSTGINIKFEPLLGSAGNTGRNNIDLDDAKMYYVDDNQVYQQL